MIRAAQPLTVEQHESQDATNGSPAISPWFHRMAAMAVLTNAQLARHDVAVLNLLAAVGLPGAEDLDIRPHLQTLDAWTRGIRAYTEDCWPAFLRAPENYDHSPGAFRILSMVTFLQRAVGMRYNLAFHEGDYDATNSRNLFIHGILSGHGGSCVSLPVLYIAIGRRLGYPLKLVQAKEHLFARWEEPGGERFNIECTSRGFLGPLGDEHFRHRPRPLSDEDLRTGAYLQSLSLREELAKFLRERANCAIDSLLLGEALQACFLADQLASDHVLTMGKWVVATTMYRELEQARMEAGLRGLAGLDLRRVVVPDGETPEERWAAPVVRETLHRIATIRDRQRRAISAQAHDQLFCSPGSSF